MQVLAPARTPSFDAAVSSWQCGNFQASNNSCTTMASTSVPHTITIDMLEDAQRELLRRTNEETDGADEQPIEVVIARGVTRAAYEALPEDWLDGRVVELRDDGTLVLVDVLSSKHSTSANMIGAVAHSYAQANRAHNLTAINELSETTAGGATNSKPHVTILQLTADMRRLELLVIFMLNVETEGRGFRAMIRQAAHYFTTMPSVERVIAFKFFQPRVGWTATLLRVPALALAFARSDQFALDGRVRIVAASSFGNAPIAERIIDRLADPQHYDDIPLEPFQDATELNNAPFTGELRVERVLRDLLAWEHERAMGNLVVPAPMVVPMPLELPALELPMFEIFVAAMEGWTMDAKRQRTKEAP